MHKHLLILLFIFLIVKNNAFAQVPPIQWQDSLALGYQASINAIQLTSDNGYIVAGSLNNDYWVARLNLNGKVIWQKTYGGSNTDIASSVQQTNDGGFIIAGTSNSTDGDVIGNKGKNDCWILKLDEAGNIEWQQSLGDTGDSYATSIEQTSDNGFIIGGYCTIGYSTTVFNEKDAIHSNLIIKLDENGNIAWQKLIGDYSDNQTFCCRQTNDGGYVFGGETGGTTNPCDNNLVNYRINIIKLNGSGDIQWQKDSTNIGWSGCIKSIDMTNDGGYIAVSSNTECEIIKIDSKGNLEWKKLYGGSRGAIPNSVQQTSDGGYIVSSASSSDDGDLAGCYIPNSNYWYENWLLKLDASGNIQWKKCFLGVEDGQALVIPTPDGGYIATGTADSDYVKSTSFLVKLGTKIIDNTNSNPGFTIYPNPANNYFNFVNNDSVNETLQLIDELGRVLYTKSCSPYENYQINTSILPSGIYFTEVNEGTYYNTQLLELQKH